MEFLFIIIGVALLIFILDYELFEALIALLFVLFAIGLIILGISIM
jgi:hypothetical protein